MIYISLSPHCVPTVAASSSPAIIVAVVIVGHGVVGCQASSSSLRRVSSSLRTSGHPRRRRTVVVVAAAIPCTVVVVISLLSLSLSVCRLARSTSRTCAQCLGFAARWMVVEGFCVGSPRLWWLLHTVVGIGGGSARGWALGNRCRTLLCDTRAIGPSGWWYHSVEMMIYHTDIFLVYAYCMTKTLSISHICIF
jgi:hypothetical protein